MTRVCGWPGAALLCALAAMPATYAQPYPTKPIRLVVGYTPGGASYVALRAPDKSVLHMQHGLVPDYSLVIETMDLAAPEGLEVAAELR